MSVNIQIIDKFHFLDLYKNDFIKLFMNCFHADKLKSEKIFNKYTDYDDAYFCLAFKNKELIALYSVVEGNYFGNKIGLSINTMSSGKMKNATKKLGKFLYPFLLEKGYQAVCGFPNNNIISIRERDLGWKIISRLNIYFFPIKLNINMIDNKIDISKTLFFQRRSLSCYHKKNIYGIKLVSNRDLLEKNIVGPTFYATNHNIDKFAVSFNLGNKFKFLSKKFGYVALCKNDKLINDFENNNISIDFDSIDVP